MKPPSNIKPSVLPDRGQNMRYHLWFALPSRREPHEVQDFRALSGAPVAAYPPFSASAPPLRTVLHALPSPPSTNRGLSVQEKARYFCSSSRLPVHYTELFLICQAKADLFFDFGADSLTDPNDHARILAAAKKEDSHADRIRLSMGATLSERG